MPYYGSPKNTPTIIARTNFDAKKDAEELKAAMKGLGCNKKAIIEILANRNNAQRIEIGKAFKLLNGKELENELKSELGGNLENTILAMMMPLPEFYAKELHDAISGLGTNEEVLIEILCTLSNYGIQAVSGSYKKLYGHTLEQDIIDDTTGYFKRLLVSLSMGMRDESTEVNVNEAHLDAEALYNAGEKIWGTDESEFNRILVSKSIEHLRRVFIEYNFLASKEIEASIKSEFSGNLCMGLLALVKCIKCKADFFAERLHKSMAGLGTDDKTLIRIIVSRSEIDLGDIKKAFENIYDKSLESWISGDTSGDYKTLLLKLVSPTTI